VKKSSILNSANDESARISWPVVEAGMRMQSRVFPYFVLDSRLLSTMLLRCTFATALTILDMAFTYLGKLYGESFTVASVTVVTVPDYEAYR
jgi:hypothetical protein